MPAHADGTVTDLASYYTLPSTIIGNTQYDTLKAAFMYYTVAAKTPLLQLMQDLLVLALRKCAAIPSCTECAHHYKYYALILPKARGLCSICCRQAAGKAARYPALYMTLPDLSKTQSPVGTVFSVYTCAHVNLQIGAEEGEFVVGLAPGHEEKMCMSAM